MADYPERSLKALADGPERAVDAYDGVPELGTAVIGILRRRAEEQAASRPSPMIP